MRRARGNYQMTSTIRLIAAIDRLTEWYASRALPLWAQNAADASSLFYESLDFAGRPVTGQHRRVRVQSRQVYTFTHAALKGWMPEGEAIAARGFARLLETACLEAGARGCVHLINDDGAVVDPTRDLYDQAFLLLACSARIGGAQDRKARLIAGKTVAFLDRELSSPHGGYIENDRGSTPRRQNPHMHLFEAMTALYAATDDPSYLMRARGVEQLFSERFLDRKTGVLREFFASDWTPNIAASDKVEPGHMMEWVALLDRYEALSGEDCRDVKAALYRTALKFAAGDDAPYLPNVAAAGMPAKRGARRLWPQTEALKAAMILAKEGEAGAADHAASIIETLFRSYLDQDVQGLWQDEYDAEGRAVAKTVPASILYHIHEAVSCAAECRHKLVP